MHRVPLLAAALFLCPVAAFAAGFEIPENGALPLARGGSTAGVVNTAYGVAFNPAGLSLIDGLDVRVDARFVNHDVGFKRGFEDRWDEARNTAGVFTAPFFTAAYGREFEFGRVGFGIGAFGVAGVGSYKYLDPSEGSDEETGHRYATLGTDTLIMYPSVALSYAYKKWLSVGVTFQSVYADISLRQSMLGVRLDNMESSDVDVIIGIDVKDSFTPTALFGVVSEPIEGLRLHANFRPTVRLNPEGKLSIAPGESIESLVTIGGPQTTKLELVLPPTARLGAFYDQTHFGVGFDLVYEGWSAQKEFILTPDVTISQMGSAPEGLPAQHIPKNWKDSFGARVGGTYKALRPATSGDFSVDVHAGGLFETNAIPSEYQSLDYVTGDRIGGSLGFTLGYKGFALTASWLQYAPVTMKITDSKVERSEASPGDPAVIIGNGTYTSNAWIAGVGLSYTGLGSAR